MTTKQAQRLLLLVSLLCFCFLSTAQGGQAEDQAACQEHARLSVGTAPASTQAAAPESNPQRGAGLRGAAHGAARGALLGGIVETIGDDDRNDATEMGAALGAAGGGMRARRQARNQAVQAQPVVTQAPDQSTYTKTYNECMSLRGYPVQ